MPNIILVCAGGISTSFLVQNIREAMAARGMEGDVKACGGNALVDSLDDTDIVLLAPQAMFFQEKVVQVCERYDIPYGFIEAVMYGTMDGETVLDFALSKIKS